MATSSLLMTRVSQLQHQSKKTYGFLAQRLVLSSLWRARNFSARCALLPPDVPRLAETARITLTSKEVEDFAPKIQQVIDWFGQLQAVDLESIEPALRADTECDNLRPDVPETFENRGAIIAAIPKYDEPYLKVPRILNN